MNILGAIQLMERTHRSSPSSVNMPLCVTEVGGASKSEADGGGDVVHAEFIAKEAKASSTVQTCIQQQNPASFGSPASDCACIP